MGRIKDQRIVATGALTGGYVFARINPGTILRWQVALMSCTTCPLGIQIKKKKNGTLYSKKNDTKISLF